MNKNIKIIDKPSLKFLKGFYANGFHCGLKKNDSPDLGIIYTETKADTFAVYTTNRVKGAPIIVAKEHLRDNKAQALIVNSKIANTCTGEQGIKNAKKLCRDLAKILSINEKDVISMSTGVIGEQLPVEKISKIFSPKMVSSLNEANILNFSKAIMTTDTYPKVKQVSVKIGNQEYGIIGAAKGSGMIHPDMATLLVFIFTDANIKKGLLKNAFKKSVDSSFNSITIDGDTSTNDTAMIFANGLAKNNIIEKKGSLEYETFSQALDHITKSLAKEIVKDGEGATKFIEIEVKNAFSSKDAKTAARAIATSSLVKTAFFGQDANWGRIICALGYSGIKFKLEKVKLTIGGLELFKYGAGLNFSEAEAKKILSKSEIKVVLDLGLGNKNFIYWTTDLTIDYVKINASYRS